MSKTRFDFVEEMVDSVFSEVFEVFFSEDKRRYKIHYRRHEDPVDPTDPCIIFHFDEDLSNLYVDKLRKRIKDDPRSGEAILNLIDKLAKLIPECKTISVRDDLNMYKCSYDFKLATITILLTGISWYNERGYLQASYMDDTEYNRKIINMTVKDALKKLLTSLENKGRFPDLMKHKKELEELLHLGSKNTMALRLSDYIRILYAALIPYSEDRNECNTHTRHQSQLSTYIINAFGHLLQYNEFLVKRVNIPPFIEPDTMTASNFEGGKVVPREEGGEWQVYDGSQFSAVSAAEPVCTQQQQQQQQQFGSLLQKTMEDPEAMMGPYGGAIKSRKPKRRMNRRTNRRTKRRTTRRTKRSYVRRGHSKGAKK